MTHPGFPSYSTDNYMMDMNSIISGMSVFENMEKTGDTLIDFDFCSPLTETDFEMEDFNHFYNDKKSMNRKLATSTLLVDIEDDPIFQSLIDDACAPLTDHNSSSLDDYSPLPMADEVTTQLVNQRPHSEHSFPWKLHDMLEDAEAKGFEDIVSWMLDGLSFKVHKVEEFVEQVLPMYFDQTKFESFRRQLNLYGFTRFHSGELQGMYHHISFVKDKKQLCHYVLRKVDSRDR